MRVAHALIAVVVILTITRAADAQRGEGTSGGSLTLEITYASLEAHDGSNRDERHWITAVVLWRGQPEKDGAVAEPTPVDTARQRATERSYQRLERAAADSGRWLLGGQSGGVIRAAEDDRAQRRLFVLGRSFDLPTRDSALVVLVDRSDGVGGPPVIVTTAYMRATLPHEFWPQIWSYGDTTFAIHPRPRRTQALLTTALRTVPAVRAFLE